jgi:hypothetical protein
VAERFPAMRLLPLPLLLAACAATGGGPSTSEADLARELAGRTAGEPRDCVSTAQGSNLVARGRQTLVYERGDTIWVNRLKAECPGLEELSQLIVEVHGSQYCRGDRFRTRQPGMNIRGPICVLDRFTPYRR